MSSPNRENPIENPAKGARINDARLDALLDAFFDKELSPEDSGDLFKGLRADKAKAREFADTRRFVEELRRPVAAPDQTRGILDAVHAKRPWLRDRDVWGVRIGRLGLVAALLMVLGGVLLQRNATPDAPVWNTGPAPLTDLVRSSGEATQRTRDSATAALATFRADSQAMFTAAQPSLVAYSPAKPEIPSVPELATRLSVSCKPGEEGEPRHAVFRFVGAAGDDREIIIRAIGPGDTYEYASTVVTFRPR
ncbi:MAG: hypothetical protein ACTS27_05485 [Phycisphaerales bacterium]